MRSVLKRSARHGLLAAGAGMALFAGLSWLPVSASAQERDPHGVAVIVGNRNYSHDRATDVTYAHRDAAAFRRYVVEILGYDTDRIIYVRDATLGRLTEVFGNERSHRGELWSILDPKGRSDVVVFYSGHGGPGLSDKRGYLLPVDAGPDTAEIGGYSLDLLYRNLGRLEEARSVRMFVDACFTGESHTGMLITKASPVIARAGLPASADNRLMVLTAASSDQLASWDDKARHGLFTKHLLDALYGKGDMDDDGRVTLAEAKSYLDDEMTKAARRMRRRQTASLLSAVDEAVLSVMPSKGFPARREISLLTPDGLPFEDVSPAASRLSQLLGRPFSADAREPSGWTDLHYAAAANAPKLIDALVKAGISVEVRLRDEKTGRPKFGEGLVRILAALGHRTFANWWADGETPMLIAAAVNARDAVTGLVSNGADVNAARNHGITPLQVAAYYNFPGMVTTLLAHGADTETPAKVIGWWRDTALLSAMTWGRYKAAIALLEGGADTNKKDSFWGHSVLHLAVRKKPDNQTALLTNIIKKILASGAEINQRSRYYSETPLHAAIGALHVWAVGELLKQGADVNAKRDGGETGLHLAARMSRDIVYKNYKAKLEILKLLLEQGANANARDENGFTPLHWAAWNGDGDAIDALVKAKADMNAKDVDGYTPLDRARVHKITALYSKLVRAGARCNRSCKK